MLFSSRMLPYLCDAHVRTEDICFTYKTPCTITVQPAPITDTTTLSIRFIGSQRPLDFLQEFFIFFTGAQLEIYRIYRRNFATLTCKWWMFCIQLRTYNCTSTYKCTTKQTHLIEYNEPRGNTCAEGAKKIATTLSKFGAYWKKQWFTGNTWGKSDFTGFTGDLEK